MARTSFLPWLVNPEKSLYDLEERKTNTVVKRATDFIWNQYLGSSSYETTREPK